MSADHHETTSEPESASVVVKDGGTEEEGTGTATNGIDNNNHHNFDDDSNSSSSIPTVPTSKDISEKLILDRIATLNIENHELKTENVEFKGKMAQLEKTCAELKQKADRATGSIESVKRELQSMVIKYATSEKEVINLKKHHAETEKRCKEALKERESLQARIKELTTEKKQLLANVERTILEAATLKHDNELLKNKLAQADVRVEQLNLQLMEIRGEHQRAKETLEKIESGIKQAVAQPTDRRTGQTKFRLVEEEEEEVGECESVQAEQSDVESEAVETGDDDATAANWTDQYLQCIERNKQLAAELEIVTRERSQYKDHIDRLEAKLTETRDQVKDYGRKVELIESLKNELISKQGAIDSLKEKFDKINCINRDLVGDIDSSKHKEGELLEYTERLTAKLVTLQSEHNILTEKLKCTEAQCQQFKADHALLTVAHEQIKSEYETYQAAQEDQVGRLTKELDERVAESDQLKRKIDELENDIKIIKRKHIASLKELNKEIQLLKKQRDETIKAAAKLAQPTDANSSTLSSRTNSFNSLSEMSPSNCDGAVAQFGVQPNGRLPESNTSGLAVASSSSGAQVATSNTTSLSESSTSSSSGELITSLNDIDRNTLIERILRLQRTLIKRNEKIDFLEEHNEQLTEEVRKKSKLLQYYILKEETGALATETMDKNKAYLSKRGGGIMASLYNSSSTDDNLTLERSLEINSKLHAVLEDTLLKNMTLKENLNTLASEIDRLARAAPK